MYEIVILYDEYKLKVKRSHLISYKCHFQFVYETTFHSKQVEMINPVEVTKKAPLSRDGRFFPKLVKNDRTPCNLLVWSGVEEKEKKKKVIFIFTKRTQQKWK